MTEIVARIEFGNICGNHGFPEYLKLSKMLLSFFPSGLAIAPKPMEFYNHFRVLVSDHLVFDSYTRYPPVTEVVKCIEQVQQGEAPVEIPHSLGIQFSYWRCPDHEGKLTGSQMIGFDTRRSTQLRLSCVSSKSTLDTSETSSPSADGQAQRKVGSRILRKVSLRTGSTKALFSEEADSDKLEKAAKRGLERSYGRARKATV